MLPNLEGNGWSEKWLSIMCIVPPAPRAVAELVKCGCRGLRENTKGTVLAQIMDWPAHLFANALQLVAATIRTITGMTKTRTRRRRRRRTLTDTSSSANSHSQSLSNIYIYAH